MRIHCARLLGGGGLALASLLLAACSSDDVPTGAGAGQGAAASGGVGAVGGGRASGAGGNGGAGLDFGENPDPIINRPPLAGMGETTNEPALGCRGLQCQQATCENGATTISGRVYDPAGKNPLYNVAVYVPNEKPEPLVLGASCDPCAKLYTGKPVVSALTDAAGNFKIDKAPDGTDIPLVIQIGKWRRQFTIPSVARCVDNALPDKMLTLPRNRNEGDIPRIAISTGAADTLECLLRRIGVDATEYTGGPEGEPRIHIFQGTRGLGSRGAARDAPTTAPAAPASPAALWSSKDELMKYDILLLSCEGQETQGMNQQALHDYASAGGRVFASHYHYSWLNSGPYGGENLATWTPGSNDMGTIGATIVNDFPKGQALKDWLANTNALVNGELPIREARHNADVLPSHTASQAWILANQSADPPGATQYLSFNTPTDAAVGGPDGEDYCGRVVFSDLHIGAASGDASAMPVPTGCTNADLSPQEKALEFMLFDLSACVIPDDRPPAPPPIVL